MKKTIGLTGLLIIFGMLFLMLFRSCVAYGQTVPVTLEEMETFARHNKERKACLIENEINNQIIDSLQLTNQTKDDQIRLLQDNVTDYKDIIKLMKEIEATRIEQVDEYKAKSEADDKTIKKQNRRLNFWRIFTPVTVTGVVLITTLIK